MWITWRHQDTDFNRPLKFSEKVEVFYQQTLGWQLHIADVVANGGKMFPEVRDGSNLSKKLPCLFFQFDTQVFQCFRFA